MWRHTVKIEDFFLIGKKSIQENNETKSLTYPKEKTMDIEFITNRFA